MRLRRVLLETLLGSVRHSPCNAPDHLSQEPWSPTANETADVDGCKGWSVEHCILRGSSALGREGVEAGVLLLIQEKAQCARLLPAPRCGGRARHGRGRGERPMQEQVDESVEAWAVHRVMHRTLFAMIARRRPNWGQKAAGLPVYCSPAYLHPLQSSGTGPWTRGLGSRHRARPCSASAARHIES
jgi:hypothetical protein